MKSVGFYCDANRIEQNALEQLRQYAEKPHLESINAFPDIHYCQENALPHGHQEQGDRALSGLCGTDASLFGPGGSRHGPCPRCRKEAIPKGY